MKKKLEKIKNQIIKIKDYESKFNAKIYMINYLLMLKFIW